MEESKQRKLVIPGEFIGEGRAGRGTYIDDDGRICSKIVGLVDQKDDMFFVIPLSGNYNPKRGDGVIGRVVDIAMSRWIVDINSPFEASMSLTDAVEEFVDLTKTDLTRYFNYNDLIFAEISMVTKSKAINLNMKSRKCRKLRGGRLIEVTPAKVPRIIGKNGSMVEMIKELSGTQIVVGQNGLVWVKGENEALATEAILEIENKSHMSGLTDYIKQMLEKKTGKTYEPRSEVHQNHSIPKERKPKTEQSKVESDTKDDTEE
jgi:exosome complex component RRP4